MVVAQYTKNVLKILKNVVKILENVVKVRNVVKIVKNLIKNLIYVIKMFNNYEEMDTDTEDNIEEDGKPQPMAGFRVGHISPGKRRADEYEDVPVVMRKSVSAPPVLAPLAGGLMFDGAGEQYDPETSRQCVYFPVDVDVDSLVDWKQVHDQGGDLEENNNVEKAALVNVNNKDIAVFKYGDDVIGKYH